MKYLVDVVASIVFIFSWLAGIVMAHGFWSTTAAIFFPPWGWYLLVEYYMLSAGWVAVCR